MRRGILLVDHGSRRPEANALIESLAEVLRTKLQLHSDAGEWFVRTAHLEIEAPDIAEGVAACVSDGAERILIHPFFLVPGRHSQVDVPEQAAAAQRKHPEVEIRVTRSLGPDDKLVEIVLDRVLSSDARDEGLGPEEGN